MFCINHHVCVLSCTNPLGAVCHTNCMSLQYKIRIAAVSRGKMSLALEKNIFKEQVSFTCQCHSIETCQCTVKHHKRIGDFAWMQVEICRNTARISAPCPEIEFRKEKFDPRPPFCTPGVHSFSQRE